MANDDLGTRAFLFELYTQTGGDLDVQVSMYDVGTAAGLEREAVEALAQSLYIQGLAEMKTLSGGIGITAAGLKFLDIKTEPKGGKVYRLPFKKNLETADMAEVNAMIQHIKEFISGQKQDYNTLEALVIDIKCIDIQMLSPRPGTEVIRQLFISCKDNLDTAGASDLVNRLDVMVAG